MHKTEEIPYSQEILRKLIHISSLAIPIIYSFVSRDIGILILTPMTIASVVIDVLMHRSAVVRKNMLSVFGKLLRPHELRQDKILLNGASYVLMSALLCVLIFPKIIAITAFSILIVSDTCAALYGRKFGRRAFLDKSREGAFAFVVSAAVVVAVIGALTGAGWTFFVAGVVGSMVGAVVEAASIRLRMDDNFSIPMFTGGLMWAMALLFESLAQPGFLALMK